MEQRKNPDPERPEIPDPVEPLAWMVAVPVVAAILATAWAICGSILRWIDWITG